MLKVNVISDSAYTVQGHGVHTAFVQHVQALQKRKDVSVATNQLGLNADITHIHTFGLLGLYHALFARNYKIISAHVVPESLVGSIVGVDKIMPLIRRFLRWFYNRGDVVIAVSPQTGAVLRDLGVSKRIEVLQNAIDTSQFAVSSAERMAARRELGFRPDQFVVLGCGQVQPRKRVDVFQALAGSDPSMQFVWVGGMPFKRLGAGGSDMEKLLNEHHDNFKLTGLIPYEEVVRHYKAADAFLFPSEQETFGLVVVEAAAAGLPVIVRDIPDYAESFGDDVIAVDESAFLHELQRLRDDPKYYETAQQRSSHLAQRYDSVAYGEKLVGLYCAIAGKS